MNLDNIKMNVIETAKNGVVNELTIFTFTQIDNFVSAKYSGGQIHQGFLVGKLFKEKLNFSYCQIQKDGVIDNGQSECDVIMGENKKIRLVEHFKWNSKNGDTGVNIFQEL